MREFGDVLISRRGSYVPRLDKAADVLMPIRQVKQGTETTTC